MPIGQGEDQGGGYTDAPHVRGSEIERGRETPARIGGEVQGGKDQLALLGFQQSPEDDLGKDAVERRLEIGKEDRKRSGERGSMRRKKTNNVRGELRRAPFDAP